MIRNEIIIPILIYVLLISSCMFFIVPKSIKKNFNVCHTGEETGLDSLINLNGYYSSDTFTSEEYYNNTADTSLHLKTGHTLFFFSDGKVAYSIDHYDRLKAGIDAKKYSEEEVGEFFKWGNYYVKGDSIVVQYIGIPRSVNTSWEGYEAIFTIKDRKTLTLIYRAPLSLSESNIYNTYVKGKDMENKKMYSDFVFEEHDVHPKPNIPKRFRKLYECE